MIRYWLSVIFLAFSSLSLSAQPDEVDRLRAFAKVYGYVRFFHPSDEVAEVDWDALAVYGAPLVRDAQDTGALRQALLSIFKPVAPTMLIYIMGENPPAVTIPKPKEGPEKVVVQQHQGVNFGSVSIYKSARTHRINNMVSGANMQLKQAIAVNPDYTHYRLRARFFVNQISPQSFGRLYMVARSGSGVSLGFKNNAGNMPKSARWEQHSITMEVPDHTASLDLFIGIHEEAEIFIDDVTLDGKNEQGDWQPIMIVNGDFEKDRTEGWTIQGSGYQATNKEHPGGLGKSLHIQNQYTPVTGPIFDQQPRPIEFIEKDIGAGLVCRIPLALYSDAQRTLGSDPDYSFQELKQKLASYNLLTMPLTDPGLQLGAVVIAWNVFQHFYPYFDVVQTDWNDVLDQALTKVLTGLEPRAFLEDVLNPMIVALEDGHGYISNGRVTGLPGFLPIHPDRIEGRIVVLHSNDPQVKRGDIITSLNGQAAEASFRVAEAKISGSKGWKRHRAQRTFVQGAPGQKARLTIERDGQSLEVELEYGRRPANEPRQQDLVGQLEDGIWYVDMTRAPWTEIKKHLDQLALANGVIFDMRGRPRDHSILTHLSDQPLLSAHWLIPQTIYPDRENIVDWHTPERWILHPSKPRFKGKVVFLTNASVISYAESVIGMVEHYKLGEIIGEPTAGANGNVNPFTLPGGYFVTWTGMKVLKHDHSQHHLIGIQPTIPLARTLKAVKEGRDEFLEKALEIIHH